MSHNLFWNLFAKKLAGEATDEELNELEQLMKANPDLLYSAQHMDDLWKLEATEDLYISENAYSLHLKKLNTLGIAVENKKTGRSGSKNRKIIKTALLGIMFIITLVSLTISIFHRSPFTGSASLSKPLNEVFTKSGSKTRLLLPDSSVVWLNSGSRLTYSNQFGVSNRNVTLTGEAFFDVQKSHVPFIIHTQSIQIKVLGTAFNVRSYPSEKVTETSLLRGRVEITLDRRPEELFVLKPNEKLVVKNELNEEKANSGETQMPLVVLSHLTNTNDSTIQETSWVENKLIFQNESFKDLANRMERWYGFTIKFSDKKLELMRFTGVFEKETIKQALEALQLTGSFHFEMQQNSILITE